MNQETPERIARRIAFYLYTPIATAWIVASDVWVSLSYGGGFDAMLVRNNLKGAAFAVVTGGLLYLFIRRELIRAQARERDHRTLTEHVPDLIFRFRVHPVRRFEFVSPSSFEMMGYRPEDYYRDPDCLLAAVHPDDRERLDALFRDDVEPPEAVRIRWHRRDGRVVWSEMRVRREVASDGRVHRISGVLRDISAERASDQLRALMAKALESAGEAVMITDRQGTIQYVNRAFTEITGYLPEDVLGGDPSILRGPERDDSFFSQLWGTIASGRTFRGVLVNRRADGRLYEQSTWITPVRGEDGAVEHFIAVARDITVERALQRRLRFTEKMDAVGQLAAGVAHDFRNLLSVILVNAELLQSEEAAGRRPGRTAREVDEILRAARRGSSLVGGLLRMGKQPEIQLRVTDLGVLLRNMRGMLRAMLPESVDLELRVVDRRFGALVDADLLQDALLNLVANAGHAMPSGGKLVLALEDGDPRPGEELGVEAVRLVVRDTGLGIPPETLERVFDPFFTTKEHGTGLGLPMVKGIVERHGGAMEISSEPGQGTTVTLLLPRKRLEAGTSTVPGEVGGVVKSEGRITQRGRVLLVEDDPRLRAAAERALRRLGYEVATAPDGIRALEQIEEQPEAWDLVLSDLVMPRMGGLELYETLQARGWAIPFLVMSGHGPEAGAVEGIRYPDFLEKPWTLDSLASGVRAAMEARRDSA